jgi:hypothetical protein
VWTEESIEYFRTLVVGRKMGIQIFSVVDEVVTVELFQAGVERSVNELMIESEYAMKREEDYLSRMNNHERDSSALSFAGSSITLATNDENIKKPATNRLLPPKGMSNFVVNLTGPFSPLESSLHGVLAVENQHVTIDAASVNSVVLNGDINEATSPRLYVASNVSINRNEGITLREVTMMPRVAGLTEILALVFCTEARIRLNSDKHSYESILAGLGGDPETNIGLLPLHDALIDVSVQFTEEDFRNINELRLCMSHLLHTSPHDTFPPLTPEQKYNLLDDVKRLMSA